MTAPLTTTKNYSTPEYTDQDRSRAANWFAEYGWSSLEVKDYTRLRGLNIGKCGGNVTKLMAAAHRDKRPGHWADAPSGYWQGESWISTTTPLPAAHRKTARPALSRATGTPPDKYEALYHTAKTNWELVKSEVDYLRALLARKGIQIVGPAGLGRVA